MSSMLLAAAAAAATPAAAAPPPPTVTAQQALDNARALTTAAPPKREECPEASGDEIVVCAKHEDPKTQYVPSNTDNGHYLRVYMGHLRQKLEDDPTQPAYLLTETAVGYRLFVPQS